MLGRSRAEAISKSLNRDSSVGKLSSVCCGVKVELLDLLNISNEVFVHGGAPQSAGEWFSIFYAASTVFNLSQTLDFHEFSLRGSKLWWKWDEKSSPHPHKCEETNGYFFLFGYFDQFWAVGLCVGFSTLCKTFVFDRTDRRLLASFLARSTS